MKRLFPPQRRCLSARTSSTYFPRFHAAALIHYLEEAYQAKLFEYHAKKLTLTPQGEELLRAATTMKHDSIHLHDHLAHLAQEKRELIFGVTLTIGSFVMPQHLAAYLRKYPQTHIHMVVANTQELLKQLDAGEIDFALVEGYFSKKPLQLCKKCGRITCTVMGNQGGGTNA